MTGRTVPCSGVCGRRFRGDRCAWARPEPPLEMRTRRRCSPLSSTALLLLLAGLAPAGHAAAQDSPALQALAGALLRMEYALKENPPAPDQVAGINRGFDRASLAFFAGQVDPVVAALDSLTARIEPDPDVRARQRDRAAAVLASLPERRRILEVEGRPPIPYRLHVPRGARRGRDPNAGPGSAALPPADPPLPVVVALHGAGGNEHMFVEAYGAGRLVELADSLGFVVISPLTGALAASPEALDDLLRAADAEHPIDRDRVYLLGHSMGAGTAWALASRSPGAFRAVACVAGACGGGQGEAPPDHPPLLAVAAELDPLSPPARVEAAAAAARSRGISVEYRLARDQGHTLVVGAVLDDIITWLLARSSPAPAGAGAPPTGGPDRQCVHGDAPAPSSGG